MIIEGLHATRQHLGHQQNKCFWRSPPPRIVLTTTRSPRMVTECLLTRSMLIKMYYHFMVYACTCTIGTVEFFSKNRFQINKIWIEPKYTLQIIVFLNRK